MKILKSKITSLIFFIFPSVVSLLYITSLAYAEFYNPQPYKKITSREDVLKLITGNSYYISAETGDDNRGKGTQGNPWKSINKVQSVIKPGDGVILQNGNYGVFNYSKVSHNWIVYMNDVNSNPVFTGINISWNNSLVLNEAKLVFYGIKVSPQWIEPGADPKLPDSNSKTYKKTSYPVYISNVKDVKLINCEIYGTNKHLTSDGIYLSVVEDVTIEKCHIHTVGAGITYVKSKNINFYYNHIHEITSSFFKDGGKCLNIKIEGNHAHDSNWNFHENYALRAEGYTPHGSFVAICSPNTTIRNNILHDGCNSSGMMFYKEDNVNYDNILIENNLLYDAHNNSAFRIYNLGENVVIRNNIFIGRGRCKSNGAMKYNAAFNLHSLGKGSDGSGLLLCNNIFVGISALGSWKEKIKEKNNIFWAVIDDKFKYYNKEDFSENSILITNDKNASSYFEDNFFNGALDTSWQYICNEKGSLNSSGHGKFLDLTLSKKSQAINFGDPDNQPTDSLGSMDAKGFININGNHRDKSHHSAGCYESL